MALLGPAPGERQLQADTLAAEQQDESSFGFFKIALLGAAALAIYKVVTGLSEQDLEGT